MTNDQSADPESASADAGAARPLSPLGLGLIVVGSIGVIAAMVIDAVAVVGRHVGVPLTGSIEMAQVAVVMLASCAITYATLERSHVAVDLLHRKFGPRGQRLVLRFAALLGFLFMVGLVAGSVWMAADLWDGAERTELMRLPLKPLRLLWIACASVAALGFLWQALRPAAHQPEQGGH